MDAAANKDTPATLTDLVTAVDQLIAGASDTNTLTEVWRAARPLITAHANAHGRLNAFISDLHDLGFCRSEDEDEEEGDVSGGDLVDLVGGWLPDLRAITLASTPEPQIDVITTVIVGVEGGLLTGATANVPGIRVICIDYDSDGDDQDVVDVPQPAGQPTARGRVLVQDTGIDPDWIEAIAAIS